MGLLLPILLGFLTCLIGGLYLVGIFRQRRPGEPPLDKGVIPWLGHVFEFSRDTLKFINRMKQKHGDVFTLQLGGNYITFLQNHLLFGQFIKDSRDKLDFIKHSRILLHSVFGYRSEENFHHFDQVIHNKHLKGDSLEALTQAMLCNLENVMLHKIESAADQSSWKEDGLFIFSYNILFRAGYLSLYGNVTPNSEGSEEKAKEKDRAESEALFNEFRKYEHLFPNLTNGVLSQKEKLEVRRLLQFFWNALSVQKVKVKDNVSGWIRELQRVREEQGMKESMISKLMFVKLWASQGNIGPSAFWLLLFLMKHPEAMRAVKEEADKVVKESGQKVRRGGPFIKVTNEILTKTPILDSALEETLRLSVAPVLGRAVLQDMTFKMPDGREYLIRKGDRVAIFPYSVINLDPEIHSDPHSFKYDRFLNPNGSKKTDFYKKEERVKYFNMPWGAGVSMCPGRFLATSEIKQFVFLMVVYFEIELKNPEEKIPEMDFRRWGFGSMQPDREVQFRYRFRV